MVPRAPTGTCRARAEIIVIRFRQLLTERWQMLMARVVGPLTFLVMQPFVATVSHPDTIRQPRGNTVNFAERLPDTSQCRT